MARRVEQRATGAADPLRILLVDDRLENLRALEAVLAPLGLPIETARSGTEALRLVLERDFGVILLDVRMPGLDGFETARLIKGRERSRDIPIVFLTATRDEVDDIVRGYELGAVDYVLKPFDADLLRSKVAIFIELQESRRALQRSEALLRGAFESSPAGITVLDTAGRVLRANRAFARLVGRDPSELLGAEVADLCHPDDRDALRSTLERVGRGDPVQASPESSGLDLRLQAATGGDAWVALVASAIETSELAQPLLVAQWVDLSVRRRAEQARAELLLEQSARNHAEAMAERLGKLQALTDALDSLSLDHMLADLAVRIAELFALDASEVRVGSAEEEIVVRAAGGQIIRSDEGRSRRPAGTWIEAPMRIERLGVGVVALHLSPGRTLTSAERSLLHDVSDRAALSIRQAQLYEEEHRIAVELQRGLLPKRMPAVDGVRLAAHYQAAGGAAEVGGDWYDAFALSGGRLGIVIGDVAGRGIPAASAMGQLRSVTRAFALGDAGERGPGEVLMRLNRHHLADTEDHMFTVLYAIVDPSRRSLTWANAGHLPPLHRSQGRVAGYLHGGAYPIGVEDIEYAEYARRLEPGDALVLYTDGLVERRGETLDTGFERLAAAVREGPADPDALCRHVLDRVLPPEEQLHDDVTAVLVSVS